MFTPRSAAPRSIIRPRRADPTRGARDKEQTGQVSVEQRATARFTLTTTKCESSIGDSFFAYANNYLVDVDAIIVDVGITTAIRPAEILQQSA
jgi:hypothetical protein